MTAYRKTAEWLKYGFEIRDDAEELLRTKAKRNEIMKIMFLSELVYQYADSIVQKKKDDSVEWYMIQGQADGLKANIGRTITRLSTYIAEYEPEKEIW